MALTAAVATAVAAVCAAAAVGVPPVLMALFLLPGVGMVAAQPGRKGIPGFLDARRMLWVLALALAALYLSGVFGTLEAFAGASWVLAVAVVPLSLMWPHPAIVRFCVLLALGSLVGAPGAITVVGWPLAVVVAASAVALVAVHRMPTRATTPTATGGDRGRVGQEATVLALAAGLIGLLVASLLDPPSGGGGLGTGMGLRARGDPGEIPPYLHPTDVLDAGGEGDGEGKEVVFRVTSAYASVWRTMTFDRYDGRSWHRSPEFEPDYDVFEEGGVFIPPGVGDEGIGGPIVDQRIRVETTSVGVLPAAPVPYSVELAAGGAYVGRDATIFPDPLLGEGATYTVASFLAAGLDELAATGAGEDAAIPADVRRYYLEHPAIPTRVRELADQLTAAAGTPYDKVVAVRDWIDANTRFRRGADPLPPAQDPVDRFLFVDRAGSSQQASSAMAVLLRSAGVPARMAAGYLPGDRSLIDGDFVVRARHAATWVEVWFPSAGWVAVDPTLRFLGPEPVDDSFLERLLRLLRALWWVAVPVVLGLGAWLAAWLLRRRRARLGRPWVTRCYERLCRAGARHGRPRGPDETPSEYCDALARALGDDRLCRVGDHLTVAAYSSGEPSAGDRAWADDVVAHIERTAPRRRRRTPPAPPPRPPELVAGVHRTPR
ncbi:MAG: DUF3488 and DUF4129 domain-containing transglutaminase family protein [Acidimicrobiia bacterium]